MDIVRQLLPIILMLGLMYFMLFLPEKKRKAAFTKMISELKINDEVTTRGGIIGKIVKLDEEKILEWMGKGAQVTDTVKALLYKAGTMKKIAGQKQQARKEG